MSAAERKSEPDEPAALNLAAIKREYRTSWGPHSERMRITMHALCDELARCRAERDALRGLCDEWLDYSGYGYDMEDEPGSLISRTRAALGEVTP